MAANERLAAQIASLHNLAFYFGWLAKHAIKSFQASFQLLERSI
jgi:hypothetical protein